MMGCYDSMKHKLQPLRLYTFAQGGLSDIELRVFASELDRLFEETEIMLREFHIPTALSYGISLRERFLGKEKTALRLRRRRELLTAAEAERGQDFTASGFERFIRGCGIDSFDYAEVPEHTRINLHVYGDPDSGVRSLLEQRAAEFLPPHINLNVRYLEGNGE